MQQPAEQLDTPFVAIDLAIMERNLKRMQDRANAHGLRLRPHTKTHKQPQLARKQVDLGALGITVAKLDEAEIMLQAGIDDILIAYPLVGQAKAYRLAALMARGLRPTVSIDSSEAMETLALAASLAGRSVDVLVEVDTGFHRCGLEGGAVLELAQAIDRKPGLNLRGLMSFAGHVAGNTDPARIRSLVEEDDALLGMHRDELIRSGLAVDTISVGGTVLSHHMDALSHATEIRPGIYIFHDRGIVSCGAVSVDDCAARVWATVVSRPNPNRAVLDAGSKMLSSDGAMNGGYGLVVGRPGWDIARLSEEHAVIELGPGALQPQIGERVAIVPNHICPVMNLQDTVVGIHGGRVTSLMPILARGGTR